MAHTTEENDLPQEACENVEVLSGGMGCSTEQEMRDGWLRKFLEVKESDVNLRFLFDNLRNFLNIGGIAAGGAYLLTHRAGLAQGFLLVNQVSGVCILLMVFLLYCLNFLQLGWGLKHLKAPVHIYLPVVVTLFFMMGDLVCTFIVKVVMR